MASLHKNFLSILRKKNFFFALFGIKNIIWQKQTTIFLPKGSFSDGIVNKKAIEKDTTTTTSKVENQFHEKKIKVENTNETLVVELFDSIKVDPSFVQDIFEFPPSLCSSSITLSKSPSCISLCTVTFRSTRPGLSILKEKMKLIKEYQRRYLKNMQTPRNILNNLQDYLCQQSPLKCMQFSFSVTSKKTKKAFNSMSPRDFENFFNFKI